MTDQYNNQDDEGRVSAPPPLWTQPDTLRAGIPPQGFKLRGLEFGAKARGETPTLESLGLEELIGASPFKSADLKANHTEPGVLVGMLAETMSKLEQKYHSGQYDAAAMPLVEQYLDEMKHMAFIQSERFELISSRISDVREANKAAFDAVYEVRRQREDEIRESCSLIQSERRVARFRKKQRRLNKREIEENRRLIKELERHERAKAKRQRQQTREQAAANIEDSKVKEQTLEAFQREAENKTKLAQEALRHAEVQSEIVNVELAKAKAAAKAAEENLARACSEAAEMRLRQEQTASINDMRQAVEAAKTQMSEETLQAKAEMEQLISEAQEAAALYQGIVDKVHEAAAEGGEMSEENSLPKEEQSDEAGKEGDDEEKLHGFWERMRNAIRPGLKGNEEQSQLEN